MPTGHPTTPTNRLRCRVRKAYLVAIRTPQTRPEPLGYEIRRNNIRPTTVGATSYADTTVAAFTAYQYKARARDPAGNRSAFGNTVSVTAPAVAGAVTILANADALIHAATVDLGTDPVAAFVLGEPTPRRGFAVAFYAVALDRSCLCTRPTALTVPTPTPAPATATAVPTAVTPTATPVPVVTPPTATPAPAPPTATATPIPPTAPPAPTTEPAATVGPVEEETGG